MATVNRFLHIGGGAGVSTDWGVMTRVLFRHELAEQVRPEHARWVPVVLESQARLSHDARLYRAIAGWPGSDPRA